MQLMRHFLLIKEIVIGDIHHVAQRYIVIMTKNNYVLILEAILCVAQVEKFYRCKHLQLMRQKQINNGIMSEQ